MLVAVVEGAAIAAFDNSVAGDQLYVLAPEAVIRLPASAEQRFTTEGETFIVGVVETVTEKVPVAVQVPNVPVTVYKVLLPGLAVNTDAEVPLVPAGDQTYVLAPLAVLVSPRPEQFGAYDGVATTVGVAATVTTLVGAVPQPLV